MKCFIALVCLISVGCVDVVVDSLPQEIDVGIKDAGELPDLSSDMVDLDPLTSPFCDGDSRELIPGITSSQEFAYPSLGLYTRDISGPVWKVGWEHGYEDSSSNLVAVVGEEGAERSMKGIWLPFGSDLNFRLADHYPYDAPPEIVPEYLAVSVLVDHQSVLANYSWEWKERDFGVQSFFMSVGHQTTQFLDVTIPSNVFTEARTYDIVVLFFKPNAIQSQLIEAYRMTLYYGSFDIPEHPCIPLPEVVNLTVEEATYERVTATTYPRNRISLYFRDPAESTERDSVLEVDKDATSVRLNVLFRGTTLENFVYEHVPMKIVTFIDYVAQDDSILIALPQDTLSFVHRDEVEIPLNSGPETIVWMVGIYNPWIPAVSWDNRANYDIQRIYWGYRSNRIILRRKP